MGELNADTPILQCLLRAEYLYNGRKNRGKFLPCLIFGVASTPGRAIGFHCVLNNGALIERLPISAFVHKVTAPNLPLDHLELWDCSSVDVCVIEYELLGELRVDVLLKDRTVLPGQYVFTVDWYNSSHSDNPGDVGHKCAHVIALENGCYCAQPNNRLRWHEPSFITKPFPEHPDYETNNQVFSVENKGERWVTEDTDRADFGIHKKARARKTD